MSEYQQKRSLEQLRQFDPEAYRKVIEQELIQARGQQVAKLSEFVKRGHLSLEQIARASCHQLREVSKRFTVGKEKGDLMCEDLFDPDQVTRKFARVMGLVPNQKQDNIDPILFTQEIANFIISYNAKATNPHNKQEYHRAEILAFIFGGSRFEQDKTPDEESDYDIDVLYAKEGYLDIFEITQLFQQKFRRKAHIGSSTYTNYVSSLSELIQMESQIAEPFRCKHRMNGNVILPLINPKSLIVAAPQNQITLSTLAVNAPPAFSEQPYGDIYYRPTIAEFEAMNMRTTPEWYAGAVEALIQQTA